MDWMLKITKWLATVDPATRADALPIVTSIAAFLFTHPLLLDGLFAAGGLAGVVKWIAGLDPETRGQALTLFAAIVAFFAKHPDVFGGLVTLFPAA